MAVDSDAERSRPDPTASSRTDPPSSAGIAVRVRWCFVRAALPGTLRIAEVMPSARPISCNDCHAFQRVYRDLGRPSWRRRWWPRSLLTFYGGFRRLFLSPTSSPLPAVVADQSLSFGSVPDAPATGIENPLC